MTDVTLVEFSEKLRRICRAHTKYGVCENCPLFSYSCSPSEEGFLTNIDTIVKIVYKWDEEHPQRKYNVRFMRYFDIEVAADNEDEAMSIADRLSEDMKLDFNDGEGDCDVWISE